MEFSEAIFGAEKELDLSHQETCEICSGTGAKIGSKMRICSTCGGRGQVMRAEQTPFGMFSQVAECSVLFPYELEPSFSIFYNYTEFQIRTTLCTYVEITYQPEFFPCLINHGFKTW